MLLVNSLLSFVLRVTKELPERKWFLLAHLLVPACLEALVDQNLLCFRLVNAVPSCLAYRGDQAVPEGLADLSFLGHPLFLSYLGGLYAHVTQQIRGVQVNKPSFQGLKTVPLQ